MNINPLSDNFTSERWNSTDQGNALSRERWDTYDQGTALSKGRWDTYDQRIAMWMERRDIYDQGIELWRKGKDEVIQTARSQVQVPLQPTINLGLGIDIIA